MVDTSFFFVHSADGPAASEESGATEPDLPKPHVGEVSVPSSGGPRLQDLSGAGLTRPRQPQTPPSLVLPQEMQPV